MRPERRKNARRRAFPRGGPPARPEEPPTPRYGSCPGMESSAPRPFRPELPPPVGNPPPPARARGFPQLPQPRRRGEEKREEEDRASALNPVSTRAGEIQALGFYVGHRCQGLGVCSSSSPR